MYRQQVCMYRRSGLTWLPSTCVRPDRQPACRKSIRNALLSNEPECNVVQTQDGTLLLDAVNSYRRAIQYQQLQKLQQSSSGAHGFYVQVSCAAAAAAAVYFCLFLCPLFHA